MTASSPTAFPTPEVLGLVSQLPLDFGTRFQRKETVERGGVTGVGVVQRSKRVEGPMAAGLPKHATASCSPSRGWEGSMLGVCSAGGSKDKAPHRRHSQFPPPWEDACS